MTNIFLKLFQKTNLIIYNALGSKRSTHLATSPLGKVLFRIMFKGKGKRVYTTSEGIQLELDPSQAMYMGIGLLGTYNQFETIVFKSLLHQGNVVIDVGTYVDGWHSLLASKLIGDSGKVYAFEPSPAYLETFKKNIIRNDIHNILTFNLALSDKSGTVNFYDAGSGSSLSKDEAESHINKKIKPIQVETITLNDFVKWKEIKHIDFIKIDVEGWEMEVLKGATNILKRDDAPDIMIEVINEVLQKAGSSADELLKYMKGFGYTPYTITKTGLKIYKDKNVTRTPNLLFRK